MPTTASKRSRSPSPLEQSVLGKKAKLDVAELASFAKDTLLDTILPLGRDEDAPPSYYEGLPVYNVIIESIAEDGHVIPIANTASDRKTVIVNGLPTPESTPSDITAEKTDPFNTAALPAPGHDSPANFAYTGDIRLFGVIPAKLSVYQHYSAHLFPYNEVVTITASNVSLGSILPELQGSAIDVIALENPRLGYAKATYDLSRPAGVYFDTNVIFQGALQPVSDFLRDFFHQSHPAIRFTAYLGAHRGWDRVVIPSTLCLRGSLEAISLKILDVLEFTTVGVELLGRKASSPLTKKAEWELDFGFFGEVNVTVPGSIFPLGARYHLRKSRHLWMLNLTLRDEEWNNCFGVKGLTLSDVAFTAMVTTTSNASIAFDVSASMSLNGAIYTISGSYSKDEYAMSAQIGDYTLRDIGEVFRELFDIELDVFDHDVKFDALSLEISTKGMSFSGHVTINGYTSAFGRINLSRDGIAIQGEIGHVQFEDVLVKAAAFDVFIASKLDTKCARASKCSISGTVQYHDIAVSVSVETETTCDGVLEWLICGELRGDVTTSSLVRELQGTFLDVSLNRLALIATNKEKPASSVGGAAYPIRKGFQFCAMIDKIPQLESLLRGNVEGMVFRAALDVESKTLSVGLILPAATSITFSNNVYCGPLEIEIECSGQDIVLLLKALLNVNLDTQPEPLAFALGLKAGFVGASAYAQMLTDWTNPCGLGSQVVIRKCALDFGIVYTTFFTTGAPGEIGLAGELAVGSKSVQAAMKLSQNPKEQLLVAEVHDLGAKDLVDFASQIIGHQLPDPGDILHLTELSLYLSTGAKIGLTEYPAGVSAKGDMVIFGKNAKFDLTIAKGIKLMASIESFQLGPFTVRGAGLPNPVVDFELSTDKSALLIDGAVEIWGASVALHLDAQLYPEPKLDFWVHLQLSDLLVIHLQAKLVGSPKLTDISSLANTDFQIYALVEQHIIDDIVLQVSRQIQAARDAAKHGFDALKAEMDEKEAAFKAACQIAIDLLEVKRQKFLVAKAAIDAEFERIHEATRRKRIELERAIDEAERDFNAFVANATADLERIQHEANAAITAAERDIEDAQRESDESIREAQADLHRAKEDLHNGFGSAQRDLEDARHAVEAAQRYIDELDRDMDHLSRRIDDEPWYNCPPLIAEKAGLGIAQGGATAGLQIARGALFAAEAIVEGADFVAAEAAIGTAELALDGARLAKDAALDLVKDTLEEVRDLQQGLTQGAINGLHFAQTACNELHVFDAAKEALRAGEVLAHSALSGAQSAVDGLAKCAEFIEFDLAEKALKFAQENTSELNLARHAVSVAEGAVEVGLDIGEWAIKQAGDLFNVRKMEFSGSVKSLTRKDGPPLIVNLEAVILGQEINLHIEWKPNFDLVEFVKALFALVWEKIQQLIKELF